MAAELEAASSDPLQVCANTLVIDLAVLIRVLLCLDGMFEPADRLFISLELGVALPDTVQASADKSVIDLAVLIPFSICLDRTLEPLDYFLVPCKGNEG